MKTMKPLTKVQSDPEMYQNEKYAVIVMREPDSIILSVRRRDRKAIFDWRDMQWIKNQLLGPESEAVQLFPAESRLVDTSNQYYLYHFPGGLGVRFGFEDRMVNENIRISVGGSLSQQRPFAPHVRPDDLHSMEERAIEILKKISNNVERVG